jgi:hypothetical protein
MSKAKKKVKVHWDSIISRLYYILRAEVFVGCSDVDSKVNTC